MIVLRIKQTHAVFKVTQVLGLREKRLDLTILLSGQVVIDGIQQFAKEVHLDLLSVIYCTAPLSARVAKDLTDGLHCCYARNAWNSKVLPGKLEERNEHAKRHREAIDRYVEGENFAAGAQTAESVAGRKVRDGHSRTGQGSPHCGA
jgi:hypothetical protein